MVLLTAHSCTAHRLEFSRATATPRAWRRIGPGSVGPRSSTEAGPVSGQNAVAIEEYPLNRSVEAFTLKICSMNKAFAQYVPGGIKAGSLGS